MKPYLLSLAAGLLVGVIYSLLNVRSPAPPAIALVGLLGILIGEQAMPVIRQALGPASGQAAVLRANTVAHVLGTLPGHGIGGGGAPIPVGKDQP